MRKKRELVVIVIILIIVFLAGLICFSLIRVYKIESKQNECQTNEDCIKTQVSCCPCNMGGREICTNKENATLIQEQLKNCSDKILCAAVYNCKEINCICRNGKCSS